jgi:lysophospholipase
MRTIRLALLVSLLVTVSCAVNFATLQSEDNVYKLSTEEQLKNENYIEAIENFYSSGKEGYFTGKTNIQIYYKIFRQPKLESPAILISSGRTEAAIKYKELIFDLYNNGYSVYIHDHRGQGLSGRMTEDPDMGYIDTFQFYIDDMKYFYDTTLKKANHKKTYLLAHSLGGAIGMTYLERNPNDFNAAAFSSPMLGFVAPTCVATKLLTGKNPKYALGQSKYQDDKLTFEKNTLTGSEIRYNRMNAAFAKDTKARLGGATYQWVYKSCEQFDYMNDNINDIQTPFILFSAENEKIVNPKAHQKFIEKAQKLGKTCEAFLIENAQHELLIEKDEQRIETINHIFNYFNRY